MNNFFKKLMRIIITPILIIHLILPIILFSTISGDNDVDTKEDTTKLSEEDILSMGVKWTYIRPDSSPAGNSTSWKLRWSPDGEKIAVVYFDNTTIIFGSKTGKVINALGTSAQVVEIRAVGAIPPPHRFHCSEPVHGHRIASF